MDFTPIVQRLNELTTFMNNVRTLSKKIFELPDETAGNKLVAVWNETDNETQKFDLTAALQGMYSLTNGLTAIGNIVRDGADFTFEVGFEWKINGIEYENEEITRTINDAGTGNHRIDIAVADINNDIYIVEGFEVPLATAVVQPPTPPNTVFLCSFLIAESVIGDNSNPQIGNIEIENISYLEILSKISQASLIPGKYYRIIDFQTVHKILGGTSVNIGEIEPLIVLAIQNNVLSTIAYSENYPKDIIYYKVTDDTAMSPSSGSKGVITYRKDTEKNLQSFYDFRNVVFRRWAINPAPGLYFAYSMYSSINSYIEVKTFGENCHDISIGSNSYNCVIYDNCYAIVIGENVGIAGSGVTINDNCHGIIIDGDSCQVTTVGSGYVGGIYIGQDSRYIRIGSRSYNIAIGSNSYAIDLGVQNSDIFVPDDSMRRRLEKGFSNFDVTINVDNSDTINVYGTTVSAMGGILYGSAQFCGILKITSPNAEENIEVLEALLTSLSFQDITIIPENGLKLNFIDKSNATNADKNLNLNGADISVDGSKGESITFFKVMEDTTGTQTSDFFIKTTNVRDQNNIPLKINILSTDLATNDIAGFVTYINELNPPLTVLEINSFVQFYLTDTNEIYQFVGVGKGVYGDGELQITSSNVLKYNDGAGTTPTFQTVIEAGDELVSDDNLRKIVISKEGQSISFYNRADVGDAWTLTDSWDSTTGIDLNIGYLNGSFRFSLSPFGGISVTDSDNNTIVLTSNTFQKTFNSITYNPLWTKVVSSSENAENDTHYTVVANATFTDPSPTEGKGYIVFVRNGTATIGGTAYGVGSLVYRVYHSGSWSNTVFIDQTKIGSATQTALNKIENFIYSKSNQILGSHTGNTAETVLLSIDISGGDFVAGDMMTAFSILNKTGTNGTATLRYRVGTTGTTADALIATGNPGANTDISYTLERRRPQFLTSNILGVLRNNTATITDVAVTSRYDSISLNPSSAWKFTITVQLSNSGDSVELIQHRIGKIKSF